MKKKTLKIEWLGVRDNEGAYPADKETLNAQRSTLNGRVILVSTWKIDCLSSVRASFGWQIHCQTREPRIISLGNCCAAELRPMAITAKSKLLNHGRISFTN